MASKRKKSDPDPPLQAADTTSRRALIGGIIVAVITVVGGITVAIINGWFSSAKPQTTPDLGIYRVRATVLDPQGTPTEEAKVWSTMGGELMKVAGGWQAEIPAAKKPVDDKLTIFASRESAYLTGQADLALSNDYNPTVTIKLGRDVSAKVRGQVVDGKNRGVTGARVFITGYDAEAMVTKEGGNFELPAHAAVDQQVLLHAEKAGYRAVSQWHPAGDYPATLVLKK